MRPLAQGAPEGLARGRLGEGWFREEGPAGSPGGTPGRPSPTDDARRLDVVLDSSPRPQIHPSPRPAGSSSLPLTASWSRLSPFTRTASTVSFLAGPPLATILPRAAKSPFLGTDLTAPPPLWAAPGASHYVQDGDRTRRHGLPGQCRLRRPLQPHSAGTPRSLSPDGPHCPLPPRSRSPCSCPPREPFPNLTRGSLTCPPSTSYLQHPQGGLPNQVRAPPTPCSPGSHGFQPKRNPRRAGPLFLFAQQTLATQMGK